MADKKPSFALLKWQQEQNMSPETREALIQEALRIAQEEDSNNENTEETVKSFYNKIHSNKT